MKSINRSMELEVVTQQPNRYYCVVLYFYSSSSRQFQLSAKNSFVSMKMTATSSKGLKGPQCSAVSQHWKAFISFFPIGCLQGGVNMSQKLLVDKDKSGQFCGLCLLNTFSTAFQQPQTQSFLSINYLCTYQEVVQ